MKDLHNENYKTCKTIKHRSQTRRLLKEAVYETCLHETTKDLLREAEAEDCLSPGVQD